MYYGTGQNYFYNHLRQFIGQTVTVFCTVGGASGCGFTGILLAVSCDYIRISTQIGTPPSNPLAENICPYLADGAGQGPFGGVGGQNAVGGQGTPGCQGGIANPCNLTGGYPGGGYPGYSPTFNVGSVVDIPICKIAAFCHNAV